MSGIPKTPSFNTSQNQKSAHKPVKSTRVSIPNNAKSALTLQTN